jgi:hypothetical protein
MIRLFPIPHFCAAFSVNPVARAGDDALYMVGLEIHASKSITPAEAEKNLTISLSQHHEMESRRCNDRV